MNIYSRGALPELFVTALTPFLLWSIWSFITTRKLVSLLSVLLLSFILIITHPMMIIPVSPLIFATLIGAYLLAVPESRPRALHMAISAIIVGILMGSYYVLPLVLELKYFYQGSNPTIIEANTFLTAKNFIVWQWPYFPLADHPGPRIGPIQVGVIELLVLVIGLLYSALIISKKQYNSINKQLLIWVCVCFLGLFFTTLASKILYDHVTILSAIQFPWRFLFTLQFSAVIIVGMLAFIFRIKTTHLIIFTLILVSLRLPEAYGKNFVSLSPSDYLANIENLHNVTMNAQWVGDTADYPVQSSLFSVIEGEGRTVVQEEKSANRRYLYEADEATRISFNTFYFPGWILTVDGVPSTLEYQDPSYRGVMTTRLDPGQHSIQLTYTDTRIRRLAKYLSGIALMLAVLVLIMHRKYQAPR